MISTIERQKLPTPSLDAALLTEFFELAGCGDAGRDLARGLLHEKRSLSAALAASSFDLARLGIPDQGRRALALAKEFVVASLRREIDDRPFFPNSEALINYLHADMAYAPVERVRVLFLDAAHRLLKDDLLIEGGVDQAPIFVRSIIKRALDVGSVGLILVHNHPSGDPHPSAADVRATHDLINAGQCLGVCVHDHLVIARSGFMSLRSLGLIDDTPRRAAA